MPRLSPPHNLDEKERVGLVMKKLARNQIVENTYEYVDCDTFEGSVEGLIARLRGWQEKHGTELHLQINHWSGGYDGCEFEAKLMVTREETDDEYERRVEQHATKKLAATKAAATKKIKREADDRKKLRELAKKYPEEIK